jgi:hypothetical protein
LGRSSSAIAQLKTPISLRRINCLQADGVYRDRRRRLTQNGVTACCSPARPEKHCLPLGPFFEPRRHGGKQKRHAEEFGPGEFHPEPGGMPRWVKASATCGRRSSAQAVKPICRPKSAVTIRNPTRVPLERASSGLRFF